MSFRDDSVAGEWHGRPARYRSSQILVQVTDSVPLHDVQSVIEHAIAVVPGSQIIWSSRRRRWAIVRIPHGHQANHAAETVGLEDGILFAEPDFLMRGHALALDDADLALQDWLDTIHMQDAWKLMVDSWGLDVGSADDVLLAVFDSGIQMFDGTEVDHPDLDAARFIVKHADATGDISHDFWMGGDLPVDKNGHGTEVTGILAATANNGIGIAGVDWETPVFVARVLDDMADTCVGAVRKAMDVLMDYADAEGYQRVIVNLSLGSTYTDEIASLDAMIMDLEAEARSVLLCCAMASIKETSGGVTEYHADYPSRYAAAKDYVVSVAATDNSDAVRYPFESMAPAVSTEITVVAPGMDAYTTYLHDPSSATAEAYGTASGTSLACPMVSGLASLLWSMSPWLTPSQLKTALVESAEKITRGTVDYFRIDASNALLYVRAEIALKTTVLSFVDVPEGSEPSLDVVMSVTGRYDLTFSVVEASKAGLDPAFSFASESMTWSPGSGPDVTGISVKYAAGAGGTSASGAFRIALAGSALEWEVQLTANSIAIPKVALALVADTSGSMALSSGISAKTRMQVLQESLSTVIDVLKVEGACALVRFDSDATLEAGLQPIVDAGTTDPGRTLLRGKVAGLVPGGSTSIGDGAKLGNDTAVADTTRRPAVLVLTDGHENAAALIADVMDDITAPVYAIGMGTAAVIEPASLDALAAATGGYLLLTDTLDDTNQTLVTKYCLQMLAEAAGESVIVDPTGYVPIGHVVEIPFWLTSHETSCDVILLVPAHNTVTFELQTPGGSTIGAGSSRAGVTYVSGDHVAYYRLNFATPLSREREGRWLARLSVSSGQFAMYKKSRREKGTRLDAHGVPYDFMVIGRSSIGMKVRAYADKFAPGARVFIRALLGDRALTPEKLVVLSAEIRSPDDRIANVVLHPLGRGWFEYEFTASIAGTYRTLVRARGYTPAGEHYTREQVVTTPVWIEPPAADAKVARGPIPVR